MSEKLTIKNFGPIKDMTFDFKKVNILIGDAGTGKSTVAKLISAINSMASGDTSNMPGQSGLMRKTEYGKLSHFQSHLRTYRIANYILPQTFITYENTGFVFTYKNDDCYIVIKSESNQATLLQDLSITYIPADRIAINLFSKEILFRLIEVQANLPLYFTRFAGLFNRLREAKESYDFSNTIGVEYKYYNEKDKIVLEDGSMIDISEASSAVQGNVPFLITLAHQALIGNQNKNINVDLQFTVIEEPELNCFPKLQHAIVKYLVTCLRGKENNFFRKTFITTHSPYILTSLNNLMFAYQTGLNFEKAVNEIIEKKYWLNPEEVSAYMLLPNGDCECILDKEGLIKAEKIDGVSGELNKEFNTIFDIELAIKK